MRNIEFKSGILNYLFSFPLFFCTLTNSAQVISRDTLPHNSGYPDLITIATVFAQNFDVPYFQTRDFYAFQFIRDPNGWFISSSVNSDTSKIIIQLWSADSGFHGNIDPLKADRDIFLADLITPEDIYDFQIYPFYGYRGWMQDVIQHYGDIHPDALSDNILYGLARAYGQSASDIFWSHSRFSNPGDLKGQHAGKKELRHYYQLSQKAFSAYQILLKRNPEYKTRVGNIQLKYANEVAARYYELKLFGFEKEVRRLVRGKNSKNLYETYWKNYAFEVLNSLDPDAILFTNGDNDTYPLLWLQHTVNFRKDVTIINLSLLNDPVYLNLLKKKHPKQTGLFPGLDESGLMDLANKLIYIEPSEHQNSVISFTANLAEIQFQMDENFPQLILPAGKYYIPFLLQDGQVDSLILLNGINGSALSFAEFFVQGLLHYHTGKIPIYFIKGMQPLFRKMIVSEHLIDKGLVYKIEKPGSHIISFGGQFYDPVSLEQLAEKNFTPSRRNEDASESFIFHLLLEAETVIIYNLQDKDTISLKMRDFLIKYPPGTAGLNQYYLYIADDLFFSEEYPEVTEKAIQEFINTLIINILHLQDEELTPWNIEKMNYLSYLLSLFRQSYYLENHPEISGIITSYENIIAEKLLEFPEIKIE